MRQIKAQPYEVTETGWGEFEITAVVSEPRFWRTEVYRLELPNETED